ncbi:hypothetical protein [Methylomonas koyamae]|uniref:hypothetical protein n=1 Tax=Methylomonas koyamae TaxID=702114 RepID=UPI000B2B68E1|nr:hypothetical protein [Methylomonas koyamae]
MVIFKHSAHNAIANAPYKTSQILGASDFMAGFSPVMPRRAPEDLSGVASQGRCEDASRLSVREPTSKLSRRASDTKTNQTQTGAS